MKHFQKMIASAIIKHPLVFHQDLWFVVVLLLLCAFIFHALPSGYWRFDDTSVILHAINSKGLDAFYKPDDWQKLSSANLTPWLTLSFKFDLWLAGLSPGFFYIHQLCSLGLVTVAMYALGRQWMSPVWSFFAVCLFLVGAPTASVAETLMTRHYLEGMLFVLLAMLAFTRSLSQQRMLLALLGALAYALAVTAKEVYVPLVFLVLVMPPVDKVATRLRLAFPFIAVVILYIIWRRYMLGSLTGGYVSENYIFSIASVINLIDTVTHIPGFIFGSPWIWPTAFFCIVLSLSLFRNIPMLPVAVVLVFGIFLPLIPLTIFPGISGPDRYLFLLYMVVSLTCLIAIQSVIATVKTKYLGYVIGILSCFAMVGFSYSHTGEIARSQQAMYQEFEVQGRFVFDASEPQGFIPSPLVLRNYYYVTNLCGIKVKMGLRCPLALIKGLPVNQNIDKLYTYSAEQKAMLDVSNKIAEETARIESVDLSKPLFGRIALEYGTVRWLFGPYETGQYYAASFAMGRYPVAKAGELRMPVAEIPIYIQYESPEGWITSSPLIQVKRGHPVEWER
ncbi:conserved membrane hypothetical protein [Gammaproteobacteria bacterium]